MTIRERISRLEEARAIINEVRINATSHEEFTNTISVERRIAALIRDLDNICGNRMTGEDFAEMAFENADAAERGALAYAEAVRNGTEPSELWHLNQESRRHLHAARNCYNCGVNAGYEHFGTIASLLSGIEGIINDAERRQRLIYA